MSSNVTLRQVIRWNPCCDYPVRRLGRLFAGRERMSWEDILALDIPQDDKLWTLLHKEFIPIPKLHSLACDFVQEGLAVADNPLCEDAIRLKRLWISGEAEKERLRITYRQLYERAWSALPSEFKSSRQQTATRAITYAASLGSAHIAAYNAAHAIRDALSEYRLQNAGMLSGQLAMAVSLII